MSTPSAIKFSAPESETAKLASQMDWTATSIGPVEIWPAGLLNAVNICLNTLQPIVVFCGSELIQIYNDAYKELLGIRHPDLFGKSFKENWKEIWPDVSDRFEKILKDGERIFLKDQLFIINRKGFPEECYYNVSYSPLYDEANNVTGVFCIVQETTSEIVKKRRIAALQLLSEKIPYAETINGIFEQAIEVFKSVKRDFPYAAVYTLSEDITTARLLSGIGLETSYELFPLRIDLRIYGVHANSMNQAIVSKDLIVMDHPEPVKDILENGFENFISKTLVFSINHKNKSRPIAILMIGVNPLLEMTDDYIRFYKTVVMQLEHGTQALVNNLENKLAEKKLRESEDHYRLATEVSKMATWDLNLATFELTHSPRFAEILGYDSKKILTHQLMHDHIHPEDLYPIVERAFDTALQTAVYNYDSRIIWPDKTLHWIRTQGKVLYDEKNIPSRMIGIMMDITELKNTEQALRESEKRFRAVADTAPVMIWMTDRDRNCVFLNKCWTEITGLTIHEGLRTGWTFIVHPDDYPGTSEKFIKAYETHSTYTQELRIKDKTGNYIWILDHAVPRYSSEGFFLGYIGSSVNINEQKNAKEVLEKSVFERTQELKKTNEELKRTNKELEQFAYVSSHDLQEPLRKIQTFSELLFNKIDKNSAELIYIEKIKSSARRMSELIRDLLDLSKVSNVDEEFVDTDLSKIIENIKTDFELMIKEKQAEFYIEKLPVVKAIPIQMNQLFYNLLNNALKFSENTPVIKIFCSEISADQLKKYNIQEEVKKNTYIKITIEDNGVGFDQNYADQIFVIFQRLNDRSKYTGTGIGLAICKRIVENHNGFIIAESKINEGSRFHIFLPK